MTDYFARQTLPDDASLSTQWPTEGEALITFTSPATGAFTEDDNWIETIRVAYPSMAEMIEKPDDHRTTTCSITHYRDDGRDPTIMLSVRNPEMIILGIVGNEELLDSQKAVIQALEQQKERRTVLVRGKDAYEVRERMRELGGLPSHEEIRQMPVATIDHRRLDWDEPTKYRPRVPRQSILVGGGLLRGLAVAAAVAAASRSVEAFAQTSEVDLVQHAYDRRQAKGPPLPPHQQIRHKRGKGKLKRW